MDNATQRIVRNILLVTAGAWLLLWLTAYQPESSKQSASAIQIETLLAHYQHNPRMVTIYGKISPLDPIHLDAEISAKIIELPVENGTLVKKGDLIAQLDTTKLNIQRISIEQLIEKTQSQIQSLTEEHESLSTLIEHDKQLLNNATDLLNRYESLSKKYKSQQGLNQRQDTVSQRAKSLQQNQTNQRNISHKVDQLKADLVTQNLNFLDIQLDINKATLTAPDTGMITNLVTQQGDLLQKGEAICELINPDKTYIHAYIPTLYFNQIHTGQKAHIQNTEQTALYLATLDQQVDERSAHLDGFFHFESLPSEPSFPLGQVVSLAMNIPLATATFTVPESAIYEESYVYVVDAKQQLIKEKVEVLGTSQQHNQTQYLLSSPNIPEGSRILTSRLPSPKTGLSVKYEQP